MNLLLAVLVLGFGDPDPATEIPRNLSYYEPAPAGLAAVEPTPVGPADFESLPTSLAVVEPAPAGEESSRGFWLGFRVGYIEPKDADNGTWLIGAQLRWHILGFLAVEASIDFHQEEYGGGDVDVFTIPIQFSAILYLPVDWKIRPYGIAGIGWYVTRTSFGGNLTDPDETNTEFGVHLGIGAEWELNPGLSLNFDFRYLFVGEPPNTGDANFDSIMLTIGINFKLGG